MGWLPPTYADARPSLAVVDRLLEQDDLAQCPITGEYAPWFDLIDVRAIAAMLPVEVPFVCSMGWRRWISAAVDVDGEPLTRRRWAVLLGAPMEHVDTIVDGRPPTLDEAQFARWNAVKILRDQKIDGGAATPFGAVDSDMLSRSNISGAVAGAMIAQTAGAPYTISWTLLDNSVATLNAAQMIGLGVAVLTHVSACHDRARQLRAAIEAAADVEAVDAIGIETGWP